MSGELALQRLKNLYNYPGSTQSLHGKIYNAVDRTPSNPHYWVKIRTNKDDMYNGNKNILALNNLGLISKLCNYNIDERYALNVQGVGKIFPRHMYPDICTPDRVKAPSGWTDPALPQPPPPPSSISAPISAPIGGNFFTSLPFLIGIGVFFFIIILIVVLYFFVLKKKKGDAYAGDEQEFFDDEFERKNLFYHQSF